MEEFAALVLVLGGCWLAARWGARLAAAQLRGGELNGDRGEVDDADEVELAVATAAAAVVGGLAVAAATTIKARRGEWLCVPSERGDDDDGGSGEPPGASGASIDDEAVAVAAATVAVAAGAEGEVEVEERGERDTTTLMASCTTRTPSRSSTSRGTARAQGAEQCETRSGRGWKLFLETDGGWVAVERHGRSTAIARSERVWEGEGRVSAWREMDGKFAMEREREREREIVLPGSMPPLSPAARCCCAGEREREREREREEAQA